MSMLEIGTKVEAVEAAKDAVLEILNTRADQKTIRVAIRAFMESIQPTNIVVKDCSFISEADAIPLRAVYDEGAGDSEGDDE